MKVSSTKIRRRLVRALIVFGVFLAGDPTPASRSRTPGLRISRLVVVEQRSLTLNFYPLSSGPSSSGRSSNAESRSGVDTPSVGDRRYPNDFHVTD